MEKTGNIIDKIEKIKAPVYFLGIGGREVYRITVKEFSKSFLKIISYNEETGELKARFRVHYQMDEAEKITYPDSPSKVLFEDGVIHTYVEKIYE